MRIPLKTKSVQLAFLAAEVGLFSFLFFWIARYYVAFRLSRKPALPNLLWAAKFDPAKSDYQWQLGRLYQYDVLQSDPSKAVDHFMQALHRNPYDPQVWLDLGAAYEFQGDIERAEACLRRADDLAPNLPAYQWGIGNFFLLHGNTSEAFRHFKTVLANTDQYNTIVWNTAWKASDDSQAILKEVIPESVGAEVNYLYYLLANQRLPAAHEVWERIVLAPAPFDPRNARGYIEVLVQSGQAREAYEVWTDLINKGLVKVTQKQGDQNLLENGDFEGEFLNMGFDWHIEAGSGFRAGLDPTTYHSPGHSLSVEFNGKENVSLGQVFQYAFVKPNHAYRLRGLMKVEGITTDSGPRLSVADLYNPSALARFSDDLTGTSMGWVPITLDFTTGPKTQLVVVRLVRFPSQKLDNLIAGKVWIDDLSLESLGNMEAEHR
jgi:hypothetical protein